MANRQLRLAIICMTICMGSRWDPVAAQDETNRATAAPINRAAGRGAAGTQDEIVADPDEARWSDRSSKPGAGVSSQPPKFLPNSAGQVWRTYDLSPYTEGIEDVEKPEQAVIDWVLRETGTDLWFSDPLGILNAGPSQLLVYHTPDVQERVAKIVQQLVASEGRPYVLQLRLVSVGSPSWRSRAMQMMKPIQVQSTGVDAWLMSKGDAALLIGEIRKRRDYTDHGSPRLVIPNGQSMTLTKRTPRSYTRNVRFNQNSRPGFQLMPGSIDEGFKLSISPMIEPGEEAIDAVIRCEIDQVERFRNVKADVQTLSGPTQRVQLQVPQVSSWRLHERFRWPTDKVLVLTCGIVATPESAGPSLSQALQLPASLPQSASRADAMLFLEFKGKAPKAMVDGSRATSRSVDFNGRY